MHRIKRTLVSCFLAAVIVVGTAIPASAADTKADILNSVTELESVNPGSPDLDEYLDELMATLIDDEMDTYEQIRACYDYVKQNTRYGSHVANLDAKIGNTTCRAITNKYGAVEGFGAVALSARVGMCNAYASAFIMMARKIGLDAYLVKGQTRNGWGGYAYHEWCEIKIDDRVYVFDPQLDQSLTKSGLQEYIVFCATYDQLNNRYIKY